MELLAPVGSSRLELARAVATEWDADVRTSWHLDSEPAAHEQIKVFHHMTPAFDVVDQEGRQLLRLVDDITIRHDLDPRRQTAERWSRVVTDDPRFLRMLATKLAPIGASQAEVEAAADSLGLEAAFHDAAAKLTDSSGASVALVAGMPGERERVCEIISPPLGGGRNEWLETVVGLATQLGFTVPQESATHVHYDAAPFRNAEAFQRLVWTFTEHAEALRARFGTNPHCTRLGPLPQAVVDLVERDDYEAMDWATIAKEARAIDGVTKYRDINIMNLVADAPVLDTVEVRTLPGSTSAQTLIDLVAMVDGVVDHVLGQAAQHA